MNLPNRLAKILCGAALALTFAIVPATWALSSGAAVPQTAKGKTAMHAQMNTVDLNTASVSQLRNLPGIGDTYANKIVAGRPYSSKDQLVTKGVLPRGVYEKIKGQVVAHRMKK